MKISLTLFFLFFLGGVLLVNDFFKVRHTSFFDVQEEQLIVNEEPEEAEFKEEEEKNEVLPKLPPLPFELVAPLESSSSLQLSKDYSCAEAMENSPFWRPNSLQALQVEKNLRNAGDFTTADLLQKISCVPQAIWISGINPGWEAERIRGEVIKATEAGKIPIFVIYDGPNHTNANWRHVASEEAYFQWIHTVGDAIGDASAWIILEPDALPIAYTYPAAEQMKRFTQLREAVQILKSISPSVLVYLDAGHGQWKDPEVIAEFLQKAGISSADGFSLNVSNHQTLEKELLYGKEISAALGGAHFVVDIGQSGVEVEGQEWCNAPGRALGALPTTNTGNFLVDAFLWIKPPGESDGTCNGGPSAGKFWLEYALQLIEGRR